MHVVIDVELPLVHVMELQQVEACQVAGGVVEEHVFAARIRAVDASTVGAGVPIVDRGVELYSGVSACPGSIGDVIPQVDCGHGLVGNRVAALLLRLLQFGAPVEVPFAAGFHCVHELVVRPHRIVAVLA